MLLRNATVLLGILFCLVSNSYAQNYYYAPEGKIDLQVSTQKIIVKFKSAFSPESQDQFLLQQQDFLKLETKITLPISKINILELKEDNASLNVNALLETFKLNESVEYANPFFTNSDGTLQGVTDRVLLRLNSATQFAYIEDYLQNFDGVIDYWQNPFDNLLFEIQVDKEHSALDIANQLHETGLFNFAEPDFLKLLHRLNTNDPNVDNQWALNNDGTNTAQYGGIAGADMNVFQAWSTTTGSSAIKVAIIDEGVDLNHPDLLPNLLSGFDATGQGSGGAPSGDDAHGTACAGIVAAVGNNNLGGAGVAYNCKIIPVRIGYGAGNAWVTNSSWIANGINWAWQNGNADVLSNSWGGGGSSFAINNAIDGAVNNGRGGLGSPVIFAAGNDNSSVSYPASYSPTIAVAAMSMCNQRKNPNSCDNEFWWGSNYGSGVDVAASGVKIFTTDISGSAGYVTGDYTSSFNGTSSACPNAAGVMALILSNNNSLTNDEARFALESTTDKVGGYTYNSTPTQPNGTWSFELGHGRINAANALGGITPPPPPASDLVLQIIDLNDVTCFGGNDGSATVVASGGNGNYSFTWNNGTAGSTAFNLVAGNYSVTVTDGISSTSTTLTISQPTPISINISSTNSTGNNNGTAIATASGGTLSYNYFWSNGMNGNAITNLFAGTYTVTVTDASNCIASESVVITESNSNDLSISILSTNDVSCFGGNDGSASVMAIGGNGSYSYSWNHGATGSSISNLSVGNYSVTASDGNQSASLIVTISSPPLLTVQIIGTNITNGNNGAANALVEGGTVPYAYLWNTGATTSMIQNLTTGTYTVTVSDNNDCTISSAVEIIDNTPPPPNQNYCESGGIDASKEWIDYVQFGEINNYSGSDNGYGDYTVLTTEVEKGKKHRINLVPGFSNYVYEEGWKIWIDFNRDGDFEDAGEQVYQRDGIKGSVNAVIHIPSNVTLGETRMRISMAWNDDMRPCQFFEYGEVEDYTIVIKENSGSTILSNTGRFDEPEEIEIEPITSVIDFVNLYPNPTSDVLNINFYASENMDVHFTITDVVGKTIFTSSLFLVKDKYDIPLDVSRYDTGIYFLTIIGKNEKIVEKFMVKQRF